MLRYTLLLLVFVMLLSGCAAPLPTTVQPLPGKDPGEVVVTLKAPLPSATMAPTEAAEPTPAPTQAPANPTGWIAYIGQDGNIWMVNPDSGDIYQVTQDALPLEAASAEQASVEYLSLAWSSDGRLLALIRQTALPYDQGMHFNESLWVYDFATQNIRALLEDQQAVGYAWKPGTHLIAYGPPIDYQYFSARGSTNASLAKGIWTVDADSGETAELVRPERGFALVGPDWSPDGRFISFQEVIYMEGRGNFAYYDTQEQKYVAWDRPIGLADWAPDGSSLVYDYLNYAPSGEERIYRSSPTGGDEQHLSPDYENGYAFSPVFSPQGDRVAYLTDITDGTTSQYKVVVVAAQGGEPRELAAVDQPGFLAWSGDGQSLLLGVGPYRSESSQLVLVSVQDGSVRPLVKGYAPAWQPAVP